MPALAVLDSGTRQIVYVEKSRGLFEPRELTLGLALANSSQSWPGSPRASAW